MQRVSSGSSGILLPVRLQIIHSSLNAVQLGPESCDLRLIAILGLKTVELRLGSLLAVPQPHDLLFEGGMLSVVGAVGLLAQKIVFRTEMLLLAVMLLLLQSLFAFVLPLLKISLLLVPFALVGEFPPQSVAVCRLVRSSQVGRSSGHKDRLWC